MILNHPTPTAIHKTLKLHEHQDASLAPHRRVVHIKPVGGTMSTDIGGPVYPLGSNLEKYYVTFTDVGSRFSFLTPIQIISHDLQALISALHYARQVRKVAPSLVHSDNTK